jgi:hypothetical protein
MRKNKKRMVKEREDGRERKDSERGGGREGGVDLNNTINHQTTRGNPKQQVVCPV